MKRERGRERERERETEREREGEREGERERDRDLVSLFHQAALTMRGRRSLGVGVATQYPFERKRDLDGGRGR